MYTIGELADMSNVTGRTLRYYDEIGLLPPAQKNAAGHRLYGEEDVSRLHYILTLRNIGLPLDTIQQAMVDHQMKVQDVLGMRLQMILEEQEKLKKMETSIHALLTLVELEQPTDWKSVFSSFYSYPSKQEAIDRLWNLQFTSEEKDILKELPGLGDKSEAAIIALNLFRETRLHADECPKSPVAQQLAKRWIDFVEQSYQGNLELANKVWEMSKHQEVSGFYYFEPRIADFIEQAIAYYYESQIKGQVT